MVEINGLAEISRLVKDHLNTRHLSLSDFQRRTGIHKSTLSAVVRGTHRPNPRTCRRLAAALGLSDETMLRLAGHWTSFWEEDGDPEMLAAARSFHELPPEIQRAVKHILRAEFTRLALDGYEEERLAS